VKIIIDYLRVINQPDNNDALLRIINIPARGIGDVTIKSIIEEANETGSSLYNLMLNSVQGRKTLKAKLSNKMQQGLSSLMNIFLTWQNKLSDPENRSTIVDLMEHVIKKISWHEYLKTQYPDAEEARWANVQELINLAADFSQEQSEDEDDEALPPIEGLPQQDSSNPLSKFLANITLASDIKGEEDGPPKPIVTISTIHAAKGLEWPVVFIPSAYQGSIPHSRAEDADEERRLLYVAMTRAKALLYLSCPLKNSEREYTVLSPFLQGQNVKVHLANQGPSFRTNVVQGISKILRRPSCTPTDPQLALDTISSLEDDQFSIELEDLEGEDEKWKDWDGREHSYTKGQRLPKRQRIGEEKSNSRNGMGYHENATSWKPEYKTTMNQVSSFTTASAAMKSGLLSATKTEILYKQSVNLIVERPVTLERSRSQKRDHTLDIEDPIERPVKKSTKSRTTKRPEGQASITSFMSRPSGGIVVEPSEKSPSLSRSHTTPAPYPKQTWNDSYQRSQSASYPQSRDSSFPTFPRSSQYTSTLSSAVIDPALSTHQLGNLSFPAPNRRFARGSTPSGQNQAYVFLSSSPQRPPTHHLEEVQELRPLPPPVEEPPPPTKPQVPPRINQPARTMHVTSMDRIAANGLRKTYGAKMGMNGWADRMKREK
jgi:DNA helicase-2/ATP-dependent DNA helicase PcrA